MAGRRFGRLVVVERAVEPKPRRRLAWWRCRCDCGAAIVLCGPSLRSGATQSCGCIRREKAAAQCVRRQRHGQARNGLQSAEYRAWAGMINRCENATLKCYPYYGGRGIAVCARWREDFLNFLADIGPRPSSTHSLDRIDVNGNYEPSNCRWATRIEQRNNRRPRSEWKGASEVQV